MITHYQLVSVWDMLQINASKFVDVIGHAVSLGQMASVLLQVNPQTSGLQMSREQYDEFRQKLLFLHELLISMDVPVSAASAADLISFMEQRIAESSAGLFQVSAHHIPSLNSLIGDISRTVKRELSSRIMLSLPSRGATYYAPSNPLFGADVTASFQSAAYEIDEAAKCFALNRHTACVFHLMRIMEIGISAARKSLGIPDPLKPAERNWGAVLKSFKDEIDARNRATPPRWAGAGDADFFAEIYVSLDAVRNVWRNATMHVEKVYVEEEAEHIFSAVRGFMKKLASRVDENGQPSA